MADANRVYLQCSLFGASFTYFIVHHAVQVQVSVSTTLKAFGLQFFSSFPLSRSHPDRSASSNIYTIFIRFHSANSRMSNSPEGSREVRTPIQEYVYRIPGPPSVWIPSPVVETVEALNVTHDASHDYALSGFANGDFLQKVAYSGVNDPGTVLDWNHQQRWTAQAVLPFLYLGPSSLARDDAFLQAHGITMILRIRTSLTSGSKSLAATVANRHIPIHDFDVRGPQDLIAAFPQGTEIINAHMSSTCGNPASLNPLGLAAASPLGKVLVCCETGNECSPCMVAAYLMGMYTMHFIKAVQIVQAQRFSADIGDEFRNILQTYHTILEAKRNVIRSTTGHVSRASGSAQRNSNQGRPSALSPPRAIKRSLDQVYDDGGDLNVANVSELERTGDGRAGQAPFHDRRDFQDISG